ncbi:MAG: flagellar basal body P-ring formation protein FlgA [Deltaproteobacteria bacterium]|nr:flagellar basal body P-ring formation protein FlgA [Deltaproteobacteria bacterium]
MRAAQVAATILILLSAAAAAFPAFAGSPAPAEILRAYVLEHRPWTDVEVRNLSLSAEPPKTAPRRITVAKGLPGRTVFSMEYENGPAVTATADVAAFDEVVVSARPLRKGMPVGEEDVCLSRMEIGRVPAGAIRDPQAVVGKILTRSLGRNLPVVDRHVAETSLVKRGRKVTLLYENGGMRIAATGETRENAYVSNAVMAVNTASKRTVTGILIDENTVRVNR